MAPLTSRDRARALGRLNGRVLRGFSSRTAQRLRAVIPLRPVLPHVEPFLNRNLQKEIRKDAAVIAEAGMRVAGQEAVDDRAVDRLLRMARDVDAAFLREISGLPLTLSVPYALVEPLRRRRMARLLDAAERVIAAATADAGLGDALRTAYSKGAFEELLRELFALYTEETLALSRGVRLPLMLLPLRERLASHLAGAMRDAGHQLAREAASEVWRKRPSPGR